MPETLTARQIEAIRPPQSGRVEVVDSVARGLCFRVTAGGDRTWSLRVKVHGRDRRFPIGEYPALSLASARKRAGKLRAEALDGHDPIEERRRAEAEERAAITVAETLDLYADSHLPSLARGLEVERALRAGLGRHMPQIAGAVTRAHLQLILDSKAKTAPVQANRLRAYLSHFFGWAERRGYVDENPAAKLARPSKERPRDRVLTLAEIGAIWKATAELGPVWRALIRVLILTAGRRSEIAAAEWSDIRGDTYAIPAARTKTGTAHIVHLSAPALAELNALAADAEGRAGLVFTTTGATPVSGFGRLKRRLDALSGVSDWRFHDFRTAFATHMAEAGEPEGVVDRVLNHAASGSRVSAVARVYQRSELLPQRARCLDRWADTVLRAAGEADGATVVQIGAGR